MINLGLGLSITGQNSTGAVGGDPTEVTLVHKGVAFTITGATASGYDLSGRPYVTGPAVVTSITPDQTTEGGLAVNGAELNPQRTGNGVIDIQGYDERIGTTYDAAKTLDLPYAMQTNDIIVKCESQLPKFGSDGTSKSWGVLACLPAAPAADQMMGAAVGWAGRTGINLHTIDHAAMFDAYPKYNIVGLTEEDAATVVARMQNGPVVHAQCSHTDNQDGYENFNPVGYARSDGGGYDKDSAVNLSNAAVSMIASNSVYTRAQQLDNLIARIRIGCDLWEPIEGSAISLYPDGGHNQSPAEPIGQFLNATGQSAAFENYLTVVSGSYNQYFRIDQAFADTHLVPHTDLGLCCLFRERTLPAQPGGNTVTIPTQYGGIGGGQGDWNQLRIPAGATMIRKRDGAEATVTVAAKFPSSTNTDINVTIDAQPAEGDFTAADVITFEVRDGSFAVGQVVRALRGLSRPSYLTMSADNAYTNLERNEAGMLTAMEAMGIIPAALEHAWEFCKNAWVANWPSAANEYPNQNATANATLLYDQHIYSSAKRVLILGQSQLSGFAKSDAGIYTGLPTVGTAEVILGQTWGLNNTPQNYPASVDYLEDGTAGDGPRAMVATINSIAGEDLNLSIMFDAVNGTGVEDLLVTAADQRRFSDLTEKLDANWNNPDVVISQWDTSNASDVGPGGDEINALLGLTGDKLSSGATIPLDLSDVLDPGFAYGNGVFTRHANVQNDYGHNSNKSQKIRDLGAGYFNGMPVPDWFTDGSGPHAQSTEGANVALGRSLGILVARMLGYANTPENPYWGGTCVRSADNKTITMQAVCPNGGTLTATTPNDLSGFRYRVSSGSWLYDGFTAIIGASNTVTITLDSGADWPVATSLEFDHTLNGPPNDGTWSLVTEGAIMDGVLYETNVTAILDVYGKGWPVGGTRDGSDNWSFSSVDHPTVTQAAPGVFVPEDEATVIAWHRQADLPTDYSGSNVTTRTDASGNGHTLTTNTAAGTVVELNGMAKHEEGSLRYATTVTGVRCIMWVGGHHALGSSTSATAGPIVGEDGGVQHILTKAGSVFDLSVDGSGSGVLGSMSYGGGDWQPADLTGADINWSTNLSDAGLNNIRVWMAALDQEIDVDMVGAIDVGGTIQLGKGRFGSIGLLSAIPTGQLLIDFHAELEAERAALQLIEDNADVAAPRR